MKLLIIGGTRFVGRALVDSALARGHEVTLFNRGQSNPGLYPQVETIMGDRAGDLSALSGRQWDAVIDTCGYVPRIVRHMAKTLSGNVGHYTFISTISVYNDFMQAGIDETYPVGTLEDETVEEVTGETYGPLKALCERAVEEEFPGRVLNIRPGLIVGPYDGSDRFNYWPYRVSRGGEVLAPGNPNAPVQIIDVRDLGDWTLDMAERQATGVYNATGPEQPLTICRVLESCREVTNSDATFTWVSDEFLVEQGVGAYVEMPLWVPEGEDTVGFDRVDVSKAVAAGLSFRPLEITIADTLAWLETRPADHNWRAGLRPEREAELLRLWHERQG